MTSRRSTRLARWIYHAALRQHPAARNYSDAMQAAFDDALADATSKGVIAIGLMTTREILGLFRREPDALPTQLTHQTRTWTMTSFFKDVKFAWRTFSRRPMYTAALVLTLALGIGANTAIFSVVNAVLLQRLPFADPDRLAVVWEDAKALGFPRNTPSPGNYNDWTREIPAFESVAALAQRDFNLTGDGEPEQVHAARVTANLFSTLGVPAAIGRVFRQDEDVPGNRVAVISYALWQRRFGGQPGIVGRSVLMSGQPYTILGVMPARFQTLDPDIHIWVPIAFGAGDLSNRGGHYLVVVARLHAKATLSEANAQLAALAVRSQRDHPDTNRNIGMFAVALLDDYVRNTGTVLTVLLVAVGCVLLVACANVANLLLTSALARARELTVRAALGADRARLIRQLLTESLMLSTAGGLLGLAVAQWSFSTLAHLVPEPLADLSRVSLDLRVLGAAFALTLGTGLLFGLAPAWRASRVDINVAASRRGVIGGSSRLSRALVVGEVAIATVLLIGASLFIASYRTASQLPLGFTTDRVLTARLTLPRATYPSFEKRVAFVQNVLTRVRALPGVSSAAYTSATPLTWKGGTSGFMPEGDITGASLPHDAVNRTVSAGYMTTVGMTLRAGRFFTEHDDANGAPVAIINKTMAEQYWPGQNALGRQFQADVDGPQAPRRTIVGIVDDTAVMGVEEPKKAEMFFPIEQSANNWMAPRDLVVRYEGDPATLAAAIRQAVREVDPLQPVSNVKTLEAIVSKELDARRTQMTLMSAFALLTLALAAIGVYGVLSHAVGARTAEIGIRLALGGSPARIRWQVVRQGVALSIAGMTIGIAAAYAGATAAASLLFQVSAHDPHTFTRQPAVLLLVCVIAAWLPARRASRIDPIVALRES